MPIAVCNVICKYVKGSLDNTLFATETNMYRTDNAESQAVLCQVVKQNIFVVQQVSSLIHYPRAGITV